MAAFPVVAFEGANLYAWGVTAALTDFSTPDLERAFKADGLEPFRARQVHTWIYKHRATDFSRMTDLSRDLRLRIGRAYRVVGSKIVRRARARDGVEKLLVRLADGNVIETVLIPEARRRTACISTQVGCPVACVFCASGLDGLKRNLTAGEIVEQLLHLPEKPTHVVVMGIGEPLANLRALLPAVATLNEKGGFGLSARGITISTVGLPEKMRELAAVGKPYNLAVSLHAATDDLRSEMLPINKKYPLKVLFPACRDYVAKTKRRITFEWALIQGKNDTPAQAQALVKLLTQPKLLCHVNVIPLNPTRDYAGAASTRERVAAFKAILEAGGVPCTVRVRRGIDINAGCGQLRVAAMADNG